MDRKKKQPKNQTRKLSNTYQIVDKAKFATIVSHRVSSIIIDSAQTKNN